MTVGNGTPIFSSIGKIVGSTTLTTAAADYTGQGVLNQTLCKADLTYGSFIQRLRCKSLGTNVASVLRVFINNGMTPRAAIIAAPAGTPTGTPSGSGGTLSTGNFLAKIYAVDQYGAVTAAATETAAVAVTGPNGSITWNWTASTGAVSYFIAVGLITNAQVALFTSTTNSYVQTAPSSGTGFVAEPSEAYLVSANNNWFYGEISLPATTAIATAATIDIDYPMNLALDAGQNIIVGLGTTVAAGWVVQAIGGDYTP